MQTFPAGDDYAHRLREARERSGKSIDEMAGLLGMSWEGYNELEEDDDEIFESVSLRQVVTLGHALNLDLAEFFSSGPAKKRAESASLETLAEKISQYLVTEKLTVDEFEETAGWEVRHALTDPSRFMGFNLLGFIEVSEIVGVDWRAVLSGL